MTKTDIERKEFTGLSYMSNEIQPNLSDTAGSLLPLLIRANAIVKTLAAHRYNNEPLWVAEVTIELRHGLLKTEALMYPDSLPKERHVVAAKIRSTSAGRWFTLDEAELIAEKLTS